ncbi:MAG: FAD:protein FMN transferase [Acidimicrobiia bacterium]
MGSGGELLIASTVDDDLAWVLAELESLEACWSRFRSESELTALNESTRARIAVTPMLMQALHHAVQAWRLTDGWFDPTLLPALRAAGYTKSIQGTLETDRIMQALANGDDDAFTPDEVRTCDRVTLDLCHGIVERPPGTAFDLGGIGKGLAADLLTETLLSRGAHSTFVSMGGDVRVGGPPPENGWDVPVQDDDGSVLFTARIREGALAASSVGTRRWRSGDAWQHHLINPRTLQPSESDVRLAVVCAAETWWAETLAKVCVLAGSEVANELLSRHGIEGWVVAYESCEVIPIGVATRTATRRTA